MSWPPLSLNQVDLLTFRTCSLSSSQTNALWSSRRSWSWRVSQGLDPVFFFLCEVAVYCCVDSPRSSLVSSPPASFRLLFPLLQRPDSQPLLLSETQWVTPPNLQHRHLFFIIYFFFPAQFFFSFSFLLLHQFVPNGQKSESSTQTGVQSSCSSSAVLLSERLSSSSMWRHARSLTSQSNLCFISICFFFIHRQMTTFKGDARAVKLFAKHIKVQTQPTMTVLTYTEGWFTDYVCVCELYR